LVAERRAPQLVEHGCRGRPRHSTISRAAPGRQPLFRGWPKH
jgi:hypothetical protein